jgi:hypothetical protein
MLLPASDVADGWHATASVLYKNWLQYISAEKKACMQKKQAAAEMPMEALASPQDLLNVATLVSR